MVDDQVTPAGVRRNGHFSMRACGLKEVREPMRCMMQRVGCEQAESGEDKSDEADPCGAVSERHHAGDDRR